MRTTTDKCDPKKLYAAQNAREGLINIADLSLLTGIAMPQLRSYAKIGVLNHYGEYHGKRFFNFEEVVNWASEPDPDIPAKTTILNGVEAELQTGSCPYSLEKVTPAPGVPSRIRVVWKDLILK